MKTVLIAGGGTGGHIYPGLAIAERLLAQGYDVQWVGARGGLEEKIVPRFGLKLHTIPIGKLHNSVGRKAQIKTVLGFPRALFVALNLVLKLRPNAVLGVGGFASGPMAIVAKLCGAKLVIWEPNAHMGLANRILARVADRILVVFREAAKGLSREVVKAGLPVRKTIARTTRRSATEMQSGLRILVFGGSQGARAINKVFVQMIEQYGDDLLQSFEVLHQTGTLDFADVSRSYEAWLENRPELRSRIRYTEYLHQIDKDFQWADLLVCRSGASTVAEVCAAGLAALFIPLPTAADNHQLKNAMALVSQKAALLIEQGDLTAHSLRDQILRLHDHPDRIEQLAHAAFQLAEPSADQAIADHVHAVITGQSGSQSGLGSGSSLSSGSSSRSIDA